MYLRSTIIEKDDILCQRATAQQAAIPLRQTTIKTEMDVTVQAILHIFYQVNHTIKRHLQHGQVETSLDLVHKGGTIMRKTYKHNSDAQFSSPSNEPIPHDWLKLISFFYCFYSLITAID